MQLMNSEKSLGLGIGGISKNNLDTEEDLIKKDKFNNKPSVDYDDTDFLQKMFSNGDNEIKNISSDKENGLKINEQNEPPTEGVKLSKTPQ